MVSQHLISNAFPSYSNNTWKALQGLLYSPTMLLMAWILRLLHLIRASQGACELQVLTGTKIFALRTSGMVLEM